MAKAEIKEKKKNKRFLRIAMDCTTIKKMLIFFECYIINILVTIFFYKSLYYS